MQMLSLYPPKIEEETMYAYLNDQHFYKNITLTSKKLDSIVKAIGHQLCNFRLSEPKLTYDPQYLANKLPNLRRLIIDYSDQNLICFAPLTNLTELSLLSKTITDLGLESLSNLISLEGLFLNCTEVTDKGVALMTRFTNLFWIDLICPKITYKGLFSLLPLQNLTSVKWSSDSLKVNIPNFQELKPVGPLMIEIINKPPLHNLDLSYRTIPDQSLRHLNLLHHITHLNLQGTNITNDELYYVKTTINLSNLILRDCSKITDGGFKLFYDHASLVDFDVTNCNITEKCVSKLKSKVHERVITSNLFYNFFLLVPFLANNDLNNAPNKRIHTFCQSERMRRLNEGSVKLSAKTIENFNNIINENFVGLSRLKCPEGVTDQSLSCLANLTKLTELDLENCSEISEESLTHIKSLKNLTFLNLTNTPISNVNLTELEKLTRIQGLHPVYWSYQSTKYLSIAYASC